MGGPGAVLDAVAAASQLRHAVDLTTWVRNVPDCSPSCALPAITRRVLSERVFGLLAETYYAAGQLASKLGYTDLASISVDRYEWAAERSGDRDDYRLCFGPTNVNIWSVGLAVEMLDGTEAITRAERFTLPRSAPRERVGHHWIDLARGYLLHGDHQRAFATLHQARRTAPQQTRYHPQVHETVRALTQADKRRTDTLVNFVGWLGITA